MIVDRLHEAFNARRFDEYAELLDQDVVMVVDGRPMRGRAAVCDYAAAVAREIRGARSEVDRVVAESGEEIRYAHAVCGRFTAVERALDVGRSAPAARDTQVYRVAGGRLAESIATSTRCPPKTSSAVIWSPVRGSSG